MARARAGDETASMISPIPTMACLGGILVDPDKPGGVHISPGFCSPGRFDGARGKTENKTENESRDGPNHELQSIGWYLSLAEEPFRRRCSVIVIHLSVSTSNESAGNQAQIFDRARIDDRIDARRDLSLGGSTLGTQPSLDRARPLRNAIDVNSIAYARIHGRCRAAKLQAAPRHRKCPVTISAAPSKQQRRRNAMAARGRRYQPRTSATMLSFSSSDQRRLRPVPTTSSLPTCAPYVRLAIRTVFNGQLRCGKAAAPAGG